MSVRAPVARVPFLPSCLAVRAWSPDDPALPDVHTDGFQIKFTRRPLCCCFDFFFICNKTFTALLHVVAHFQVSKAVTMVKPSALVEVVQTDYNSTLIYSR